MSAVNYAENFFTIDFILPPSFVDRDKFFTRACPNNNHSELHTMGLTLKNTICDIYSSADESIVSSFAVLINTSAQNSVPARRIKCASVSSKVEGAHIILFNFREM